MRTYELESFCVHKAGIDYHPGGYAQDSLGRHQVENGDYIIHTLDEVATIGVKEEDLHVVTPLGTFFRVRT